MKVPQKGSGWQGVPEEHPLEAGITALQLEEGQVQQHGGAAASGADMTHRGLHRRGLSGNHRSHPRQNFTREGCTARWLPTKRPR